jgi:hypothetical protein
MQWLLQQGFFGPDMRPDMLLSVTTGHSLITSTASTASADIPSVSSPFRGTQLVYTLGERTDGAPAVSSAVESLS